MVGIDPLGVQGLVVTVGSLVPGWAVALLLDSAGDFVVAWSQGVA